jgi:predicted dehydrogenase
MARCALSHNGSHLLTLVSYLAAGSQARCEWVFGQMEDETRAAADDDLSGNGYLQFSTGVQAFVRTMPCGAGDWDVDVLGTSGRLRAINDGDQVEFWKLAQPALAGRRREPARHGFPAPRPDAGTANVRTVRDLLEGLRTGKEPNCNGEMGRQALEVAVALRESHRRGGVRIPLPLDERALRIESSETLHGDDPVAVRRARA